MEDFWEYTAVIITKDGAVVINEDNVRVNDSLKEVLLSIRNIVCGRIKRCPEVEEMIRDWEIDGDRHYVIK